MAAFKFIDLGGSSCHAHWIMYCVMHYCCLSDHNNFVGAAEIRHILVCMGEMITDEEIDMMISMVDLDGDGQVG